ncbi:hypothetical protein G210_3620 [Candida maltosa Xu316]|uniref:Uncharacterized protein n=1 Tax=Candida maltosa (strain Xu316) TaxID=1245528 RepID=M3JTH2_CANMX|nr:hypothetical protein G210_3620 [Candida maltosa Xu316]
MVTKKKKKERKEKSSNFRKPRKKDRCYKKKNENIFDMKGERDKEEIAKKMKMEGSLGRNVV